MAGNMDESKILITNYPRINQYASFVEIGNENETLEIICGYDIKVDAHEITLQIARDLITALLTFDKIYIEGHRVVDLIQVLGSINLKELLRLHLLCLIPDQELNPVMMKKKDGNWQHGFFAYAQSSYVNGCLQSNYDNIHKWSHIENWFNQHNFKGVEAQTILYLIDENSIDIGNIENIKEQINEETNKDIFNPMFLHDSNFYRIRNDGYWEYNQLGRLRLQELNKNAILAATLNIDNIKMDAAINELMLRKTASAFSKDIHVGTDALIRIEQQKGFPDLGELFIKGIVKLDDILKLRNDFQGKIFRYWAQRTNYEEQLMRQEVMNSVHNILGSKCMNPIRFIGTNLIGLLGFIPGLAASAVDSFILDKILKGWHPNFFLDNKLKKMIDNCIAEEHRRVQRKKLNEAFKGVGRNDLCPCGSGKKYKKCHGKDL